MRVLIGYDEREARAAEVAAKTLRQVSGLDAEFLCADKLAEQGLLTRPVDWRGGQDYDLVSQAPQSTRFAVSRFLAPLLHQSGYVLFVDCDMVFLRDPREMLAKVNPLHAVSVVKHEHQPGLEQLWKMVNQTQTSYARKNWSSVALYNADHAANRRLNLSHINNMPGRWLHAFGWLHDSEIGDLDPCWNWLVDVQPRPLNVGIAHLTLGGPYLPGWKGGSFDSEWLEAAA